MKTLDTEFVFSASRSSGAGGQHVNKVSTKAELRFDVKKSTLLTDDEKLKILDRIANKLTLDGVLIITSQATRSLLQNKQICIKKFYAIVELALIDPKIRKKVKPSKAWHAERLDDKKRNATKKQNRKKDFLD